MVTSLVIYSLIGLLALIALYLGFWVVRHLQESKQELRRKREEVAMARKERPSDHDEREY